MLFRSPAEFFDGHADWTKRPISNAFNAVKVNKGAKPMKMSGRMNEQSLIVRAFQ